MVPQTPWLQHVFNFDFPVRHFPLILERFRGTPARIDDFTISLPATILTTQINNAWSIQEHVGHLLDLSELDDRRLHDYLSGAETLTPADMENKKTHESNHNANSLQTILKGFRRERTILVQRLEALTEEQVSQRAIHPRLKQSLRLVDWVYFMSEHDDHHIARMSDLARTLLQAP